MITVIHPARQRIKMMYVVTPHVTVIAYPVQTYISDWYGHAMLKFSTVQIK